jgi:hypothetical protein
MLDIFYGENWSLPPMCRSWYAPSRKYCSVMGLTRADMGIQRNDTKDPLRSDVRAPLMMPVRWLPR